MREELLQEAFRKYGTPLYVFDLDILKEQTERIRAGFGPEINLCYRYKKQHIFFKRRTSHKKEIAR